jgi:hypothetical protein
LLRKITSVEFILGLGLMCDSLQEISELILDLPESNIDLNKAHNKTVCLVKVFEWGRKTLGPFYRESLEAADTLVFEGVFYVKNRIDDPPIYPNTFYESLKMSNEKRLLSSEDVDLPSCSKVLDANNWPKNVMEDILYGEEEILKLSNSFQFNERDVIRGFREYLQLQGREIPKQLLQLKRTLETIAISSNECERGFSQINLVVTPAKSSLSVKTITSLLCIKIVEPPLTHFEI